MSADVRSIDAVIDWRADLTNYTDLLAEAMAGVDLEIRRAYGWLEDQLTQWRRAIRDCEDEVVRAKAELSQRKFPTWDGREPDCTVQEKNLRIAKARLEHAQDKAEATRRWIGRLPKLIDESFTGPSRRLKSMLEADLPNALTELGRRIAALETYASLRADYAPGPSATSVSAAPPAAAPDAKGEKPEEPNPPAPFPEGKGEKDLRIGVTPAASEEASRAVTPFPEGKGAGGVGLPENTP